MRGISNTRLDGVVYWLGVECLPEGRERRFFWTRRVTGSQGVEVERGRCCDRHGRQDFPVPSSSHTPKSSVD